MQRAYELTRATGVAGSFQVVYFVHTGDMHAAEALAHQRLAAYRMAANKEFFTTPLRVAVETLEVAAAPFPIRYSASEHIGLEWRKPLVAERGR